MLSPGTTGHPYHRPYFILFSFLSFLSFAYLATVYPLGIILAANISHAPLRPLNSMPLLCEDLD
jgi:hypothetical protein